jgi:hypothetical protein
MSDPTHEYPPSKPHPLTRPTRAEAFWGPRKESPEQIATRVVRTFLAFRDLHPALAKWYHSTMSIRKSLSLPLDPTNFDEVVALVRKGRQREEIPPYRPMKGLGCHFAGWNGQSETGEDLRFAGACGGHRRGIPNSFYMSWGPASVFLQQRVLTESVLDLMVNTWEPDYCQVAGLYCPPLPPYHGVLQEMLVPEVGWMLYLADRHLLRDDVPSAHEVRPLGNGTLVIVSDDPIDTSVPEHWMLANRVREELGLPFPYQIEDVEMGREVDGSEDDDEVFEEHEDEE